MILSSTESMFRLGSEPFTAESQLRSLMREWWPKTAIWVEAARGGTVGAPDCFIPVKRNYIPVELKCWELKAKSSVVLCQLRPSQYRFHMLAHAAGLKTAVLFSAGYHIYVIPGWLVPLDKLDINKCEGLYRVASRQGLIHIFSDEEFWGD